MGHLVLLSAGFMIHPNRPLALFSSTLPMSSSPHSLNRTRALCKFTLSTNMLRQGCLSWTIHWHHNFHFSPKGIWWTSYWTPRLGCWSSGWLWSWCPNWWNTSSGRCSCLENMVSENTFPFSCKMHFLPPGGTLDPLEADRRRTSSSSWNCSLENVPCGSR